MQRHLGIPGVSLSYIGVKYEERTIHEFHQFEIMLCTVTTPSH
jgi:hypothetical protein